MRDEIKNVVIKAFGLERLDSRGAKAVQISAEEVRPNIKYIWIVTINFDIHMAAIYIFPDRTSGFEGLHANIFWLQESNEDEPSTEIKLIKHEISDDEDVILYQFENDDVAKTLTSMNLLAWMPSLTIVETGDPFRRYEVFTVTASGTSYSDFNGLPQSDNQRNFMKVVHQKLFSLAKIYDDPKINKRINWLIFVE